MQIKNAYSEKCFDNQKLREEHLVRKFKKFLKN
jgi:hypothetical protein